MVSTRIFPGDTVHERTRQRFLLPAITGLSLTGSIINSKENFQFKSISVLLSHLLSCRVTRAI